MNNHFSESFTTANKERLQNQKTQLEFEIRRLEEIIRKENQQKSISERFNNPKPENLFLEVGSMARKSLTEMRIDGLKDELNQVNKKLKANT